MNFSLRAPLQPNSWELLIRPVDAPAFVAAQLFGASLIASTTICSNISG
jgi:hypothetical protein